MKTIIAAFTDREIADQAAAHLQAQRGYGREDLRLLDHASARALDFNGLLRGAGVPEDSVGLYAEAMRRGSTILIVNASDDAALPIAAELDRFGALDLDAAADRWRAAGWTSYDASAAPYDEREQAVERDLLARQGIPVIEEEVRVGKREVPRETVRVRTFVTERPVHKDVPLREEHIAVHREAVDEPLPAGAAGSTFQEDELEVTAKGEEVVVGKEARVVERVRVEKEAETRTEAVDETERRREVEVERMEPSQPRRR